MMHPGAPAHMMAPPPPPMSINMERHIQQTNERLMVIQQQLMQPHGFVAAIKELLDWCSDIRAFQPQYESGLMGCVNTVNRFCASPGFDLQLGFKLLAVCFQQRDRFNPHNAGILARCYEDVRNVLLMRNQRVMMNSQGIDVQMASQEGALAMAQAAQVAAAQAAGMGGAHNGGPPPHPGPPMNNMMPPQWAGPNPSPPIHQHVNTPPPAPPTHHDLPPTQQSFSVVATVVGNVSAPPTQPITSMTSADVNSNSIPPLSASQLPNQLVGGPGDHSAAAAAAAAALAAAAATATATATVTAQLKNEHLPATPQLPPGHYSSPPNSTNHFPHSKAPPSSLPHTPTLSATPPFPPLPKNINPGPGRPATPTAVRTPTSVMTPTEPNFNKDAHVFNQGGVNNPILSNPLSPLVQPNKSYSTPPPHSQGAWPQVSPQQQQPMQYQQYSPHPRNTPPPRPPHPPQQPMQYQQYPPGGVANYPPNYLNSRPDNLPLNNVQTSGRGAQQQMQFSHSESFQLGQPPPANTPGMIPEVGTAGQKRPRYSYPPSQPSPLPSPSPQLPSGSINQRYPGHYSSQSPAPQPATPTMIAPPPYGVPTTPTNDQFYAAPSPHTMMQTRQFMPSPAGMQSPPSYHPPTPISMATGQPMYPHAPQHTVINSQTLPHQLRLTFAVRDGVLLKPFQLEHGRSLIQVPFHLKESVHEMLLSRNDLELQFKCYHHDDKQELCNWPQGVSVRVNGHPLHIDRGDSKHLHKPLHLKQVCQPTHNYLEITVTACCCSHLFVLQLVHRPSVGSVLQGLLRKRLLPAEHCVAKIKRWFQSNNDDSIQQTGILVSLKCPITFKRIQLPARGADCKHIQCFDLQSYLQLNCDRGTWRCPVCNNSAQLEGLEVDQYIWGILSGVNNNKMEVEEITIDPSANWKAHSKETDEEDGPVSKRMKNEAPGTPKTPASIKKPHSNPPPPHPPKQELPTNLPPPPHLISNNVPHSLPPPPLPLPPGLNGSNNNLINNNNNQQGGLPPPPPPHTQQQQMSTNIDDNLENLKEILDNIGDPHFFDNLSTSGDQSHSNELLSILES